MNLGFQELSITTETNTEEPVKLPARKKPHRTKTEKNSTLLEPNKSATRRKEHAANKRDKLIASRTVTKSR